MISIRVDRSELRRILAVALLTLISLVAGLGQGLHALVGCSHCPAIGGFPLSAWANTVGRGRGGAVDVRPGVGVSRDQRPRGWECPVCALMARFRATPATSVAPLESLTFIAYCWARQAPCIDCPWTTSCQPRGPPGAEGSS